MNFAKSLKTLDKDVANTMGKAAIEDLSAYIRTPGVTSVGAMEKAADYTAKINTTNSAIKSFRDGGERYIERMSEGLGVHKGVVRELLGAHIIANLNNPEQLGDPIEYITGAIKKEPGLLVDKKVGANTMLKAYSKFPSYEKIGGSVMNPTGMSTSRLGYRSKQKSFYDLVEETDKKTNAKFETPQLRLGADGLVTDDVFDAFYNYKESEIDFRTSNYIDAEAKDMIAADNAGKSPTDKGYIDPDIDVNMDLYRKKFVTNFLKSIPTEKYQLQTDVVRAKPTVSRGGGRGRSAAKKEEGPNYMDQVMEATAQGPDQLRSVLLRMKAGAGSVSVDDVVMNPDGKTFEIRYRKKDGSGAKTTFDYTNPNFRSEMTGFYQRASGADVKAEKKALTTPTKASPKPAAMSIKRSDIPAKAKAAGYSTAEYESLLKQKGVKIID